MRKLYFLSFLLLTGCISGKISHKSQVQASQKSSVVTTSAAKVDESKNYHQVITQLDTVIQTVPVYDTEFINAKSLTKPISLTKAIGKGFAKATYTPETGVLSLIVHVPVDTIHIQQHVITTDITDNKKTAIDSSRNSKHNDKENVKGSTSLSASIGNSWMIWVVCFVVGLILGWFWGLRFGYQDAKKIYERK